MKKGYRCVFLPEKVIEISNGQASYYFKGTSLPCNDMVASQLSCNKNFLRQLLREHRIPTPRTLLLRHPAAWRSVLKSTLRFPLVVKPIDASHGDGASLNLLTPAELRRAVEKAFTFVKKNRKQSRVLVEEHFEGTDLRLFVVGDRVVSVVQREPAYVIGDGQHNIRELIHAFNKEWRSSIKFDFPLCPIPIDSEVSRFLKRKKVSINSVPQTGEKITLRWNANVSTGGRPTDVTDAVHPKLKELAVHISRLSHLNVSGVDFICKDYTKPDVTAANLSVLEINDSPGFDIHYYPFQGKSHDVASDILDFVFQTSARTRS